MIFGLVKSQRIGEPMSREIRWRCEICETINHSTDWPPDDSEYEEICEACGVAYTIEEIREMEA